MSILDLGARESDRAESQAAFGPDGLPVGGGECHLIAARAPEHPGDPGGANERLERADHVERLDARESRNDDVAVLHGCSVNHPGGGVNDTYPTFSAIGGVSSGEGDLLVGCGVNPMGKRPAGRLLTGIWNPYL